MTKCKICKNTIYNNESYCFYCSIKTIEYTEDYKTPEFKDMIMTYSDKTLGDNK